MTTALKQGEYYLFVRWIATPEVFRTPKTQGQFSDLHKVGHDTLARWKKDPNFWEDVKRFVMEWSKEKTPDVVAALYVKSVKGNPLAIKLWLQYIEGFSEKTEEKRILEAGETLTDLLKREWLEKRKPKQIDNGTIER